MFSELGRQGYRLARRIAVAVIGGTVLLVGIIMIVTPGPALVVIPLGLAILAVEFAWARRWLTEIKGRMTPEQLDLFLRRNGWRNGWRRNGRGEPPKSPPESKP